MVAAKSKFMLKNNEKMYYDYAYYNVIDNFITIHNFLKIALSSILYIINDVIMCSNIMHFPISLFLYINLINSATL